MRNTPFEIVRQIAEKYLSTQVAVSAINQGVSSDIYKITSDNLEAFIKLSDSPETTLKPEYDILINLINIGVRVPKVLHFEDIEPLTQKSVLILEKINGSPAVDLSNNENRKSSLIDAGKDLAKINSIKMNGFGYIDIKRNNPTPLSMSLKEITTNGIGDGINELAKSGFFTSTTSGKISNHLSNFDNLFKYDYPHLSHGDMCGHHIFIDNGKYSGIIDFGDIRATSKFQDLAHLKFSSRKDEDIFMDVLEGYQLESSLTQSDLKAITFESILILLSKTGWSIKYGGDKADKYDWVEDYIKIQLDQIENL